MAAQASDTEASGLLLIEHLNLNVLSTEVALLFYEALGCCRDASRPITKTLHCNCGALTQFHTPSPKQEVFIAGSGAQCWRGEIELLYKDVEQLQVASKRIEALLGLEEFKGSKLSVSQASDRSQGLAVTGPYGNRFVLRISEPERLLALGPSSGLRKGSENCSIVGLGTITLEVPVNTAEAGAQFYSEVLGFGKERLADGRWAVSGGPNLSQKLILTETATATDEELGEHMAIYIADFENCFRRLHSLGLIWVNPRFEHLDNATTVDEAVQQKCFRFKDIVDTSTGRIIFRLEHEVRSTQHKSCPLKR